MKSQYLSESNGYQKQWIAAANEGRTFISTCIEGGEFYNSYATLAEAKADADEGEAYVFDEDTDAPWSAKCAVWQLIQDEDGDWMCDFEDKR
jgi:hypothetical protein